LHTFSQPQTPPPSPIFCKPGKCGTKNRSTHGGIIFLSLGPGDLHLKMLLMLIKAGLMKVRDTPSFILYNNTSPKRGKLEQILVAIMLKFHFISADNLQTIYIFWRK
jgi:hypothetical protein